MRLGLSWTWPMSLAIVNRSMSACSVRAAVPPVGMNTSGRAGICSVSMVLGSSTGMALGGMISGASGATGSIGARDCAIDRLEMQQKEMMLIEVRRMFIFKKRWDEGVCVLED